MERLQCQYDKDLDIRNIEALPPGRGCKFLVCLNGHDGALIAKSWHRKEPATVEGYTVITF